MATRVRSHAKINLGLYLGAPRPDGFHSLVTAYQTLEVHDIVTVSSTLSDHTTLRLTSNDSQVPCDERNTAWKMVSLALEGLGLGAKVDIQIEKRLPVQGGLGAGSGNAVAALKGLERELNPLLLDSCDDLVFRVIPKDVLVEKYGLNSEPPPAETIRKTRPYQLRIAEIIWSERVGSDVPLFLVGGLVLGQDRGQKVSPLPDFEPTWCLVVIPEVGV